MRLGLADLLFCSQAFQQNPEYPSEQLMHIYYRVTRSSGEVSLQGNGDDVLGLSWVSLDDLNTKRILAVDQEFIAQQCLRALFTS